MDISAVSQQESFMYFISSKQFRKTLVSWVLTFALINQCKMQWGIESEVSVNVVIIRAFSPIGRSGVCMNGA